jgi:hypothetical protein
MAAAGRFASFLFGAGKWFSVLFALLALAGIVGGAVLLGNTYFGRDFEVPKFKDDKVRQRVLGTPSRGDMESQETKLRLTTRYGQEALAIVREYAIFNETADGFIEVLMQVPEEHRDKFMSGLRAFMVDGMTQLRQEGRVDQYTSQRLARTYVGAFHDAVVHERSQRSERRMEQMVMAGSILSGMMMFILAIILPVLVHIERNTRAAPPIASAPVTPAARRCTTCGTPLTPGAGFCDECGTAVAAAG